LGRRVQWMYWEVWLCTAYWRTKRQAYWIIIIVVVLYILLKLLFNNTIVFVTPMVCLMVCARGVWKLD
jgi:hypothetical protein